MNHKGTVKPTPPSQESIDAAVYRVTEWAFRNSTIVTTAGTLRYDLWLQSEVERLAEKWTEAWIEEGSDGRIALFKWNKDVRPVEDDDEK